jgi:hypothetical protein
MPVCQWLLEQLRDMVGLEGIRVLGKADCVSHFRISIMP